MAMLNASSLVLRPMALVVARRDDGPARPNYPGDPPVAPLPSVIELALWSDLGTE